MTDIDALRDQLDALERMGQGDSLRARGMRRRIAELQQSPPKKQKRDKNGRFCK